MEYILKSLIFCGFVCTVPIGEGVEPWGQWGLAGLVIGYVLWRDWQREKRMSSSIELHEQWVRDTLIHALQDNTEAIKEMNSRAGQ